MRDTTKVLLAVSSLWLGACEAQSPTVKDTPPKHVNSPQETCLAALPAPVAITGGLATIGRDDTYPEEGPARTLTVEGFDIDAVEVTNAQFRDFVAATGYVTDAEKQQAGFGTPGGAVFIPPTVKNPSWWQFVKGANWRNPEGPESSIHGHDQDPVVQVSLKDAKAYAEWAGRRLPTEVEWEYAAKAGSETLYIWGEEKAPKGKEKANTWQGAFPVQNTQLDGYRLRAPVGCYDKNGFGLYDMIGNVWEWTDTPYTGRSEPPQYIIKGGSFLCAPNYCRRYRAAAFQPQDADFTTNHIGFRTVSN